MKNRQSRTACSYCFETMYTENPFKVVTTVAVNESKKLNKVCDFDTKWIKYHTIGTNVFLCGILYLVGIDDR